MGAAEEWTTVFANFDFFLLLLKYPGPGPGYFPVVRFWPVLEAAHLPLLAVGKNPVVKVRSKRVVARAAVDYVPHSYAARVEVPADYMVVAVAPVEAVLALAADDSVPVAVAVEGVGAVAAVDL